MTSLWAQWRLKSPASRLFTQPFIQGADQRRHQSSVPLAFVRGIHRSPVNSPHKGPVTRKMFPFDDVIMFQPLCVNPPCDGTGIFRVNKVNTMSADQIMIILSHRLTHLPPDKMAANSQTIFSDAFSWMKSSVFSLKFHWSLLLRVQLILFQHRFR